MSAPGIGEKLACRIIEYRREHSAFKDLEELKNVKGMAGFRYEKVKELTQKQYDLIGQLDNPSKNATHSRWKNDVILDVQNLEKEKMDIFKLILADGIDPYVTTPDDINNKENYRRLSEVVKEYEDSQKQNPIANTNATIKPKLTLIKPEDKS